MATKRQRTDMSWETIPSPSPTSREFLKAMRKEVGECSAHSFWGIIDQLRHEIEDKPHEEKHLGFYHNRKFLAEAYKEGRMYICKTEDTHEVDKRHEELKPYLADYRDLLSFCVLDSDGEVFIIWTHPDLRHCGCAKTFIRHFKIKTVTGIVEGSEGFWKKVGVKVKD